MLAMLGLLTVIAGCTDADRVVVEGSRNVVTETRTVGDFERISVEGFGHLDVEVGPNTSLSIEAEDNVLPHLITEVQGATLIVTSRPNASFQNVEEPVYTITTPALAKVTIAGSGSVTVAGLLTQSFEVTIAGSGDLVAPGVQLDSFDVSIGGSGFVTTSGVVESVDVSIEGSGRFGGADLVAADVEVTVSGSGNVVVNATDNLGVTISGSGNVTYLGDATLTQSISGSGTVSRG
jgi:hypothetical protein